MDDILKAAAARYQLPFFETKEDWLTLQSAHRLDLAVEGMIETLHEDEHADGLASAMRLFYDTYSSIPPTGTSFLRVIQEGSTAGDMLIRLWGVDVTLSDVVDTISRLPQRDKQMNREAFDVCAMVSMPPLFMFDRRHAKTVDRGVYYLQGSKVWLFDKYRQDVQAAYHRLAFHLALETSHPTSSLGDMGRALSAGDYLGNKASSFWKLGNQLYEGFNPLPSHVGAVPHENYSQRLREHALDVYHWQDTNESHRAFDMDYQWRCLMHIFALDTQGGDAVHWITVVFVRGGPSFDVVLAVVFDSYKSMWNTVPVRDSILRLWLAMNALGWNALSPIGTIPTLVNGMAEAIQHDTTSCGIHAADFVQHITTFWTQRTQRQLLGETFSGGESPLQATEEMIAFVRAHAASTEACRSGAYYRQLDRRLSYLALFAYYMYHLQESAIEKPRPPLPSSRISKDTKYLDVFYAVVAAVAHDGTIETVYTVNEDYTTTSSFWGLIKKSLRKEARESLSRTWQTVRDASSKGSFLLYDTQWREIVAMDRRGSVLRHFEEHERRRDNASITNYLHFWLFEDAQATAAVLNSTRQYQYAVNVFLDGTRVPDPIVTVSVPLASTYGNVVKGVKSDLKDRHFHTVHIKLTQPERILYEEWWSRPLAFDYPFKHSNTSPTYSIGPIQVEFETMAARPLYIVFYDNFKKRAFVSLHRDDTIHTHDRDSGALIINTKDGDHSIERNENLWLHVHRLLDHYLRTQATLMSKVMKQLWEMGDEDQILTNMTALSSNEIHPAILEQWQGFDYNKTSDQWSVPDMLHLRTVAAHYKYLRLLASSRTSAESHFAFFDNRGRANFSRDSTSMPPLFYTEAHLYAKQRGLGVDEPLVITIVPTRDLELAQQTPLLLKYHDEDPIVLTFQLPAV